MDGVPRDEPCPETAPVPGWLHLARGSAVASAGCETGGAELPCAPAVGAGPRSCIPGCVPGGVEEQNSCAHCLLFFHWAPQRSLHLLYYIMLISLFLTQPRMLLASISALPRFPLGWNGQPSFVANKLLERRYLCILSMGRTSQWTSAGACWGNSTGPSWVCELYFDKIHDIYWARVRAVAGRKHSEWAYSSELQLYRDTIVGPPRLSWLLQGDILSVNIIMPLTPYRRKTGSHKPVDQVLLKLWYWLHLYEGDVLVQQVPCRWSGEEAPCTFRDLKPSTQYCIRTAAADMSQERSREAEQCVMTAAGTAGFPWVLLVVLSGSFLLLTLSGLCFLQRLLFHSPSETHLPKTLGLLNRELSVSIRAPTLELQQDSLALLLLPVSRSCGLPAAEQTPAAQQLLTESLSQDTSGYCANGFEPDCQEGTDPSCVLHPALGQVLGCQVSLPLEEDVEMHDDDDVLEQPVPVGLVGDGYTGDREYQTSKTWLSLHLQLYSKCQCPAPEAGSCLPLPTPGRTPSQEDERERLGLAGHWVPLSSVKLPASEEEEEDGGQFTCTCQPLCGCEATPQNQHCPAQEACGKGAKNILGFPWEKTAPAAGLCVAVAWEKAGSPATNRWAGF